MALHCTFVETYLFQPLLTYRPYGTLLHLLSVGSTPLHLLSTDYSFLKCICCRWFTLLSSPDSTRLYLLSTIYKTFHLFSTIHSKLLSSAIYQSGNYSRVLNSKLYASYLLSKTANYFTLLSTTDSKLLRPFSTIYNIVHDIYH